MVGGCWLPTPWTGADAAKLGPALKGTGTEQLQAPSFSPNPQPELALLTVPLSCEVSSSSPAPPPRRSTPPDLAVLRLGDCGSHPLPLLVPRLLHLGHLLPSQHAAVCHLHRCTGPRTCDTLSMLPELSSCRCVQLLSLPSSEAALLPSSWARGALRGRRLSHPQKAQKRAAECLRMLH